MDLRHLLEARIRDFREREREGKTRPAPKRTEGESLESGLMKDIRSLRKKAREASDEEEKRALLEEARSLETQLMVVLESSGRPLAARLVAETLRAPEPEEPED